MYRQDTTFADYSYNERLSLSTMFSAILSHGQLLPCPKEAVADPLSKYLL